MNNPDLQSHLSCSWSHSRGFQWGSGLEIGPAMTGSWSGDPPSTLWLTWRIVLQDKNNPQSWRTLSEQIEASFFLEQPCTWFDSDMAWYIGYTGVHTRGWHFFGNPTGHGIPAGWETKSLRITWLGRERKKCNREWAGPGIEMIPNLTHKYTFYINKL